MGWLGEEREKEKEKETEKASSKAKRQFMDHYCAPTIFRFGFVIPQTWTTHSYLLSAIALTHSHPCWACACLSGTTHHSAHSAKVFRDKSILSNGGVIEWLMLLVVLVRQRLRD